MKLLATIWLIILSCTFPCLFLGCVKNDIATTSDTSGTFEKSITSFQFKVADNPNSLNTDVNSEIGVDTISVRFPYGTILDSLKPIITYKGKNVNPATNVAQNFKLPVTYKVTAEDNSTKTYTILATVLSDSTAVPDSSKSISSFVFKASENSGSLASDVTGVIKSDTIEVKALSGTQVKNLIPEIVMTGVNIIPGNRTAQDFTAPVSYTVQAADGTSRTYTVVVSLESSPNALLYVSVGDARYKYVLQGHLYAINAATGVLSWNTTTTNWVSPPNVLGDFLYMGDSTRFYSINRKTGSVNWNASFGGGGYSQPTILDGTLYISSSNETLYAVDAASGLVKWSFSEPSSDTTNRNNFTNPTVVNGVVYAGSANQYVYAIDAATGSLKWRFFNTYGRGAGYFTSNPSVVDGTLYIGDAIGNFFALNALDGSVKWIYNTNNGSSSSPTVRNGIVYFGDMYAGAVHAVDAATGTVKWRYDLGLRFNTSPTVSDGMLYIAGSMHNGGTLYALDAMTGVVKWTYAHSNNFDDSSPVYYNGSVYIGSYASVLAVNARNGTLKWKFTTFNMHEDVNVGPCIVDEQNTVYVPGTSGNHN